MNLIYALINASQAHGNYVGDVISRHRTLEAAERTKLKLNDEYVKTVICKITVTLGIDYRVFSWNVAETYTTN